MLCGEGGIRTLGTVAGTTVFKTVTFNHSVTSPSAKNRGDYINSGEKWQNICVQEGAAEDI